MLIMIFFLKHVFLQALTLVLIGFSFHASAQVPQDFLEKTVPKKYPQLVQYLKKNGPQEVKWTTQSREQQSVKISFAADGALVLDAKMQFGTPQNASGNSELTAIKMIDRDLNSTLDRLEALPPNKRFQALDNPRDDGSLYLWYSTLAIVFSKSSCCMN
jgi:hypothetical protein